MVKNYLKIALRNLKKNKLFSFINIVGLATGLAACMLMAVYVYDELNYDNYPQQANHIYRVELSSTEAAYPHIDIAVGEGMKNAFPEVQDYTRITPLFEVFFRYGDKQFKEEQTAFADANFLQMFSIPMLEGDAISALKEANSMVVTRAFATKYFGTEPAIGKLVHVENNLFKNELFKVTGVIDKTPDNSHFHKDAFISMATAINKLPPARRQTWSNVGYYTYLLLNKNVDVKKLESKFPQLITKYVVPEVQQDMGVSLAEAQKSASAYRFYLLPLTDIHLYSNTKYELEPNGDINYVYIFGTLAIVVLLLACVNFTNLSIATSTKRGKEVGIRKVIGSVKRQLIFQFLTESVLLSFMGIILAFTLVFVLLPNFNALANKHIQFNFFLSFQSIASIVLLGIVVGVLAGVYPAFFLSAVNTITVLKGGTVVQSGNKNILRSALVVFQFAVSIALIIATLIVFQQLHFMQNKERGFDKEQVVYLQSTSLLGNNEAAFKQQLLQDSRIINASIGKFGPGSLAWNGSQVYPKEKTGKENISEIHANIGDVDYDYLATLGIKLVKGRNFSKEFVTDSTAVIINETAVRDLGWGNTDPIGKTIVRSGQVYYKVIGVVADFHYASTKQRIEPLMLLLGHANTGGIFMKIKTNAVSDLLADVKEQWDSYKAAGPFAYYFLDDKFAALYAAEQRTGKIFTVFAILSIIIASLGLFGLAAFIIEQRNREIGIRKVLGASITEVLVLVSKGFLLLVIIAFIISVPVTWWVMHKWLQDFAYRINISSWVFLLSGAIAVSIALLAISYQAIKAAMMNPIKSLRAE